MVWRNAVPPGLVTTKIEDSGVATGTHASTSTAAMRAARVSTSVLFDPKDAVVGDQYGVFKIIKARYEPPSSYPDAMYSIYFSGTTTITGVIGAWSDMGCFIPLKNIPNSMAEQLPRSVAHPQIPDVLDLSLDDVSNVYSPHVGDAVEVTIDQYVGAFVAKECGGNYGHVTSIKKI